MVIFPDPLEDPTGEYLCIGGNLRPETLITAYSRGIFPWYGEGDPLLWHCPHPRCVLLPRDWHISTRSRRKILHSDFVATLNTAFERVIAACAEPRGCDGSTWIFPEIKEAYTRLHLMGYAHSVEIWQEGNLAGGLYGVALGHVFFGESMFHRRTEASRAALAALIHLMQANGLCLLDCQQASPHMLAMGACQIPRATFIGVLNEQITDTLPGCLAGIKGKVPLGL